MSRFDRPRAASDAMSYSRSDRRRYGGGRPRRRGRLRHRAAGFEPADVVGRAATAVERERRMRLPRDLERLGLQQGEAQAAEAVRRVAREVRGLVRASGALERDGIEEGQGVAFDQLDRRVGGARQLLACSSAVGRRAVSSRREQRVHVAADALALAGSPDAAARRRRVAGLAAPSSRRTVRRMTSPAPVRRSLRNRRTTSRSGPCRRDTRRAPCRIPPHATP